MEAASSSGAAVALSAEPGSPAPCCPHGPALLFVKISQGKEEGKRFYACSACRDRKDCSFFQWENEKVSDARLAAREEFNRSRQPSLSHRQNVERLHELIQINGCEEQQFNVKSLLLDIDFRYSQFYTEEDFCHYNMFNHYFFGGKVAQEVCRKFLHEEKGEGVIMVTDPPFGGLVEALAFSFKKLIAMWREAQEEAHNSKEMPIFWIFPYFFESRILEFFPGFTMMDYQVDYDNHMLYKHGKTGRKQSPVRIFTNLSPSTIVLPIEEGYRFCSLCQRYVSSENQHCEMCNSCTSKDGRRWRHCVLCQKCVKPSWVHCNTCNHCALQDHVCESVQVGCFICGGADHKRSTCPHFSVTRRAYQAEGKQRQMKNKKLKMGTIKKPSVKQRKMRVLKGKIKNKKE
ncbi:rRNA N6-adenosine-methyltransferase ZCCHC4 isoform X3 [Alligator mississippiensis]|uniref:rRNA N6-adenosine-methyltransferase ZCCHC4 isoform X3 n=1 Tax=Alligator mississippiensis TaxID=8496 RepID=UPI0009076CF9|nr:rRNA N6-adenosine-methyltransferase ZCCHC4 isoform X3 [Alligator mississippiensis]